MNLSEGYCYPQPGKPKALAVCEAFARGSGWKVSPIVPDVGKAGAMFYGVRPAWAHLWIQARARGLDVFYADNAYFDAGRESFFRVTRNAIQCSGIGKSDGKRLKALGVDIKPWQQGSHILICAQSGEFMRTVALEPGWLMRTVASLQSLTDRPLVIRSKHDRIPLQAALRGAHAVVTWSSAAAIEALVAGVPAVCSEACAAWPMATALFEIETPRRPDGREEWAGVLADNQWTLAEIARGDCWSAICG